jgi:glycosyltransferase involved in cell wall biosynthesis
VRLGLIARADNSGLGTQCWEFYRHLQPYRVLIIDVSHLHNDTTHTNKRTFLDRYPNPMIFKGWQPTPEMLKQFLSGLDVVFTAESTYGNDLIPLAHRMGVKVVIQPNAEFLDVRQQPDLWAPPTGWLWESIPEPKVLLPVPIATDRFKCEETAGRTATNFLHLVGRPAVHDRNGTLDLLQALQHVTADVTVSVRCQTPGYVSGLVHEHNIRTPNNVVLRVDSADVKNYWENYDGDVLLMPRRFGGLCLPVLEALGAGMPCVMPDISPNNTWLPTDWLVPATVQGSFMAKQRVEFHSVDPRDLAQKIDRFATDTGFYTKAKTEALELRDQNSWSTLKPLYIETLEAL